MIARPPPVPTVAIATIRPGCNGTVAIGVGLLSLGQIRAVILCRQGKSFALHSCRFRLRKRRQTFRDRGNCCIPTCVQLYFAKWRHDEKHLQTQPQRSERMPSSQRKRAFSLCLNWHYAAAWYTQYSMSSFPCGCEKMDTFASAREDLQLQD